MTHPHGYKKMRLRRNAHSGSGWEKVTHPHGYKKMRLRRNVRSVNIKNRTEKVSRRNGKSDTAVIFFQRLFVRTV